MDFLAIATVAAVIYGLVSKRYERALAIGAITPAGVAISVGEIALPTFYAVAIGGFALLVVQWLARGGKPAKPRLGEIPGVSLLLIFLGWGIVVTLIAPLLFPGLRTVTITERLLAGGTISTSNIAQILYMALAIAVVVILARSPTTTPFLLAIPLGIGIALSLVRYLVLLTGAPFPDELVSNSPTMVFIETAAGDVPRFRGIFSEPSALAGCALAAMAYGTSLSLQTRGLRRVAAVALVAVAIFLGIISTSTTFLVAGVILLALAILTLAFRLISARAQFTPIATGVAIGLAGISLIVVPPLIALFTALVGDKVGSDSFDERSGADADSYLVFLQTWGFGVGLGSGRASSFIATLVSTTGVIGTLLFVAALASVMFQAASVRRYRPVLWVLIATLIGKFIAGPDLSDPSGILWLSLGILAHGALIARNRSRHTVLTPFRDTVDIPAHRARESV